MENMTPKPKDVIACWFSCGAASAVAAKLTVEKYGNCCSIRVVNNPIQEEDEDNFRFLKDVEKWIGVEIETAKNPAFPDASAVSVWDKRRFMSGPQGAPCTVELKKKARQFWETSNKVDWHVLGFTSDEKRRYDRFVLTERNNVLPILIDQNLTKQGCFDLIKRAGIKLPRIYHLGYPNANCVGCVKATSPSYWNHVRKVHPIVFQQRAKQSRELGARLVRVNGQRIFLDELTEDAKGKPMKEMQIECGIFCEEQ